MNIWEDCEKRPLPKVLSVIVDNRGKTVPVCEDGNHILIATNCIRNENLYPSYEKIRLLSEETYQNWFRAHPLPKDIIFVCKGTPGRVCMVPDPIDFCIAQDMVALRTDETIVYNQYLLAILRSREIQEQIANTSVGDVIPHFKKQYFDQLLIPIPPMDVQRAIGDLYFDFCLKIEKNKRINSTVEDQTDSIFKKELLLDGDIPSGWKKDSLLGIADYLNGLAMQKYRPADNEIGLPVLKIRELRQGFCDKSSELCTPTIKEDYIVKDGDVIFSWSGSLLVDLWCGGTCGLNQHLFKVTSQNYDKWFYYAWTKHHLKRFKAIAADMATTMGHIRREELSKSEVLIPPTEKYNRLTDMLEPMYNLIITNRRENKKLEALRDTIMPQVFSGELDIGALIEERKIYKPF